LLQLGVAGKINIMEKDPLVESVGDPRKTTIYFIIARDVKQYRKFIGRNRFDRRHTNFCDKIDARDKAHMKSLAKNKFKIQIINIKNRD
jgi:hypothetical protein